MDELKLNIRSTFESSSCESTASLCIVTSHRIILATYSTPKPHTHPERSAVQGHFNKRTRGGKPARPASVPPELHPPPRHRHNTHLNLYKLPVNLREYHNNNSERGNHDSLHVTLASLLARDGPSRLRLPHLTDTPEGFDAPRARLSDASH